MTNIEILEYLELEIGSELSLLDLDERVEKYIGNENIESPLSSYTADEIIQSREYIFYTEEGNEIYHKINFDVVKNTGDENSIVKIIR